MVNSPAGIATSSPRPAVSTQSKEPPPLLVPPEAPLPAVPPELEALAPEPVAPEDVVAPWLGSPIESGAFPSPQPRANSADRLILPSKASLRPCVQTCAI